MAQILQPTPANFDLLAQVLAEGDIVAVPTETVYGLAGNALDSEAIAKIYAAKKRPTTNPLIVHVFDLNQLHSVAVLPASGKNLADQFWPGPLTMILTKKPAIPKSATAGLDTVAIRMPSHPVYRDLASRCDFPLAAPSANPFGYISPTQAEHVDAQLGNKIGWILDGGPCDRGIESTIISLTDPTSPTLLRYGSISKEELEAVLQVEVVAKTPTISNAAEGLVSPGLLNKHYSPQTPLLLFEGPIPSLANNEAVVFLELNRCSGHHHFSLSSNGNLEQIAKNLYGQLQAIDKMGYQKIHLELAADSGLGRAIRDRMKRAAAEE